MQTLNNVCNVLFEFLLYARKLSTDYYIIK